jgi:hypothetical protein
LQKRSVVHARPPKVKHYMTIHRVALVVLIMFSVLGRSPKAQDNNPGKGRQGALTLNGIPNTISYQGMLSGAPGAQHQLTIALYTDSNALNPAIWQDTYNVTLSGGVFSVLLGAGNVPLPPTQTMNQQLWLGVAVDGENELRPLSPLTSVPYALNVANGSITAEKLSPSLMNGVLLDTANNTGKFLEVWPGGGFGWGSMAGTGTVTSVNGSGGTTGLTLTGGPITTSGTLTLGGTLAPSNGGTGQTTLAGTLKALLPDSTGGTTKVLTVKPGGGFGWTNNGATVTHNISPINSLDGNANNYPIDPGTSYIRLASSAGIIELSGLASAGVANGRVITISNIGAYAIVIKHQGASAPGNQFDLPGGSDIILAHGGSATFIYDQSTQQSGFWELVSTN